MERIDDTLPPPPGETGTELTGSAASAALNLAFQQLDSLAGRRFNVFRPSAWFPSDFVVLVDGEQLRVQNASDTYLVSRDKFDAEFGKTFMGPM